MKIMSLQQMEAVQFSRLLKEITKRRGYFAGGWSNKTGGYLTGGRSNSLS